MMDFYWISALPNKNGVVEIKPEFRTKKSKDLMIRGGDFYAVWIEEKGMWSTDEDDVTDLIDSSLYAYAEEHKKQFENGYKLFLMSEAKSGQIDKWHKLVKQQMRDNFVMLDPKVTFLNTVTTKEDYVSKRLSYPLEEGEAEAYEHLMSTLYSPEERHKIEWAIGGVVTGASKKLQKFIVLYGDPGTGKSTVLDIIEAMFEGYVETVDARALGDKNDQFSTGMFGSNPLIAIDHESNLSRIEDNSKLNTIVSHNKTLVNEKHLKRYSAKFNTFLFLASNEPVKITNAKSGLLRRLIDVTPTGNKLKSKDYFQTMERIGFEYGKIANRCKRVFEEDPHYYDDYKAISMMSATNDFFNFVEDSYYIFKRDDGVSEQAAWDMYKVYCEDAKVLYPYSRKNFKEELKNYFSNYSERITNDDGTRTRKYYSGFRTDKFETAFEKPKEKEPSGSWLIFDKTESLFDKDCADCPAQYAGDSEKPIKPWDDVMEKLSDLDTSQLHYVRLPENHIVIDFDIPDDEGNKSFEKNLAAASLWPRTYAELSKSGAGIHLHYIYTGDPSQLSRVYGNHIEIKVFTGKSSLRRKLSKCNDIPFASIASGLPLKEVKKKMADEFTIKSEATLVNMIKKNLRKEYHSNTKPSVDYIYYLLEKAYEEGIHYDVSWMYSDIYSFASSSTNQADECRALVRKMKFQSKEVSEQKESDDDILTIFDVEVSPNHFLICYQLDKDDATVVDILDPTPDDVYTLIERKLCGYNSSSYDDHMLYARMIGETAQEIFNRSNSIIKNGEGKFREARLSYLDIYQILSKKQSLKKWEIELGEPHKEFPIPWDEPIPDDRIQEWIEYCKNDVRATRALLHSKVGQADLNAHKILVVLANGKMIDSTNQLTAKIIFQGNKTPQSQFNYRNMGECHDDDIFPLNYKVPEDPWTRFTKDKKPVFPGYIYSKFGFPEHNGAKSWYRDEDPKEGGYVYAEPGIHTNVALLDIASMHPSSIIAEDLFGETYTKRFKEIVDVRILVKHKLFDEARQLLDGALAGYLTDQSAADELSSALKIAINAVYGQTSGTYQNPFRDERNIDNIVAKRGALFMINLKHKVQEMGCTVAHIKTDSIKIPNATPEIIQFVMDYGKLYGYSFEHEATYEKMCLVNDAVYIAKYASEEFCKSQYNGYLPTKQKPGKWTATGTQFQVPYVFKKLFSHEEIEFKDVCETKEVKNPASLYLDFNEKLPENEHNYSFVGRVGLFCPVKDGNGGAQLMRGAPDKDGAMKYGYASGAKGYKWMEADMVKNLKLEDQIDYGYYDTLVDKAADAISGYGDLEWFLS